MADTAGFFGFDTTLPSENTAWDEDETTRPNRKNDETFGPGAGDWSTPLPREHADPVGSSRRLVSQLENMAVNENRKQFSDDPAILSLQEVPRGMQMQGSNTLQDMEKIWNRVPQQADPGPPQVTQQSNLQNMEKIWNRAPQQATPGPPPQVPQPSGTIAPPSGAIAPPPGFGPPPGFPARQTAEAPLPDSLVATLSGTAQALQRGLNVEELERQHFAEGLDSLSRRATMVNDSPAVEAAKLVAHEVRQPPQGTIGQLHPEHRRALERNRRNNDNRNRNQQQHRRRDPYANLMSRREREWITSMQLRALEIKNPEIEDYYYVNYMKRLMQKGNAKNQRELVTPAPKESNRNRKRNDSERCDQQKDDKDHEKKENKPWSEGSLGKPVSSSVHNPRKMIQILAKSSENNEPTDEPVHVEATKSTNKLKLLKEIESAFLVLMDLELMVQDELRNFGQESKKTQELVSYIKPNDKVRLVSLLSIRKGKRLLQRTLPYLNQEDAAEILICFFNNLALLIKRDAEDEVLHELYDVLANTINTLDLEKIIEMASRKRHNNLKPIACQSFGASMICKLLDRGQILLSQMSIQEFPADWRQAWLDLVKTMTREITAVAVKGILPPMLGVYPALAKALERSASQKHLISHLNGTQSAKTPQVFGQSSFGY